MPKKEIDYSNTIIYKITCKEPSITELYVGHTTNFVQRKHAHKQGCTNSKSQNYKCKLYEVIRNNRGWDNWKMEIVNFFNCKDHYEARKKEQEYFILLHATLNSIEPLPFKKPKNPTPKVIKSKEKKIFYCEKCNIHCNTSGLLEKHNNTKKHNNMKNDNNMKTHNNMKKHNLNILKENDKRKKNIFECKSCDFSSSKEIEYNRHISTSKHKKLTNLDIVNENTEIFVCNTCSKQYFSRVGLWKHYKICNKDTNKILNETEIAANTSNTEKEINHAITKDMFMELINDNKEMIKIIKDQQEQIKSMIPKMGNTINNTTNNNNFNLNVFLNEQCKDAININEFIKSLKITLEDLYFTRKNGIAQGISNLMINGLKELDVYKRPIHCTDFKRDTVYIKEHDKWEKDSNNTIMKKTIETVANKQRNKISDWVDLHPHWIEDEKLQYEYLTILNKITEPIEDDDKIEKKIIRNIAREVQITDIKKY